MGIKNKTLLHQDQETIVACATPQGPGAIALIRLSGQDAIQIADKISRLASDKLLSHLPTHTIHYGLIIDEHGVHVDQVLFFLMRSPRTFTGQDTVEISCHNNPFIIEKIIASAIKAGARHAHRGEFTRRAFLHEKIDLIQAESIHELICAQTEDALKISLAQLEGSLSSWAKTIEQDLVRALALSEASFEFIEDEDVSFGTQISELIQKCRALIAQIKTTANYQQQIREGIRIAFIGSVNAGKSSLFNALLKKDRAIVTNIAGTTRDVIEAGVYKDGAYHTLIDTAGLRETNDCVEKIGIEKSMQEAQKADIIVLVYDGSKELSDAETKVYNEIIDIYRDKVILVQNKTDLSPLINQFEGIEQVAVSTVAYKKVEQLEQMIRDKIKNILAKLSTPFLLNKRQLHIILRLDEKLQTITDMLVEPIAYELVSYHLKDALEYFEELSGKSVTKEAVDTIFRDFCIGK